MPETSSPVDWVDLQDPDEAALIRAWPHGLEPGTLSLLCAPAVHDDLPRPRFQTSGDAVLGVFLLPILLDGGWEIVHQEIDVVLTAKAVLTVRKSLGRSDGAVGRVDAYSTDGLDEIIARNPAFAPGRIAHIITDDVAEAFLDLVDQLTDRIDDLEDRVESDDPRVIQREISQFRHDLVHLRRIVTPTRDAVRRVVDGRIEVGENTLFPRELELEFGDVYDKLLRAGDALETARELIGGVRDYVQTKVANDQNEVMKRLTAAASILLVPTFIVGLYGQNFVDIPELNWSFGYVFSWGLIIASTVVQIWWFRRKRWL